MSTGAVLSRLVHIVRVADCADTFRSSGLLIVREASDWRWSHSENCFRVSSQYSSVQIRHRQRLVILVLHGLASQLLDPVCPGRFPDSAQEVLRAAKQNDRMVRLNI